MTTSVEHTHKQDKYVTNGTKVGHMFLHFNVLNLDTIQSN